MEGWWKDSGRMMEGWWKDSGRMVEGWWKIVVEWKGGRNAGVRKV